jgi:type I restriction enzyme S subunit
MNKRLVPKLRFPEFDGEWQEKKLGEITKINQGLQIPISERYLEQVEGSHFYITNEFLKEGSNKKYFIKNPVHSVLCVEDDLLMTRTGNTGMVVTGVRGAFHNNFFKIKYDDQITSKWFLYYFLTSRKTQYNLLRLAGTSTIPDLNHGDFYKIGINIPILQEQTKIADFLTAVDNKIQQLTRKKELLEQYKKSVMQQIFSQKIRFKDDNCNDYPAWEEKRLGDLFDYKNGGSFEEYVVEDGLYKLITLNSIDITGKLKEEHKTVNVTDNSLNKNDLVMVLSDVAHGNFLGLTDIIDRDDYVLNQRMGALKPKVIISTFFVKTFINYNQKYFKLKGQGSSQQNLSKGDIICFKINMPCLKEQNIIAEVLTLIDRNIGKVSLQLQQTQIYKNALLQQMFI